MQAKSSMAFFWPYDSVDDIFRERVQPEFGLVPSVWRMSLDTWQFFYAPNRDFVPRDFALPACDASAWYSIETPSVWQSKGFGFPSTLLYDERVEESGKGLHRRFKNRFSGAHDAEDEVGVYRTWVHFSPEYLDRAVYFECSGIRGRFSFFVNGRFVMDSPSIYTPTRILLSPYLSEGDNLITILIYHFDETQRGGEREEIGSFGLNGIFRTPEIVAESLVELEKVFLSPSYEIRSKGVKKEIPTLPEDEKLLSLLGATKEEKEEFPLLASLGKSEITTSVVRSYEGKLQFSVVLKNHLQFPVKCQVIPSLFAALSEYDPYHLPEIAIKYTEMTVLLSPNEEKEITCIVETGNIKPWTHETPNLYDLVLSVVDANQNTICVKKRRFGFTSIKAEDGCLFVQDKKIQIQGIRYYSFDPVEGLSVALDRLRQDVILMKQAGLNMVFPVGFPPDPLLFLLCDQYGLYLAPQSRVQSFQKMWESMMSHPSVAFWSFSPSKFDESLAWECKQKNIRYDTRPFYLEKDHAMVISDISPLPGEAGNLFGIWSDIAIDMKEMKRLGIQWVLPDRGHQTKLLKALLKKEYRYIHQADLEEVSEAKESLIMQGIVGPNREIYPSYRNVKKLCEPMSILTSEENPAQIIVENKNLFRRKENLIFSWQLLLDGRAILKGETQIDTLLPLEKKMVGLDFSRDVFSSPGWMEQSAVWQSAYENAFCKELLLDIRVIQGQATEFAPSGFVNAFFQQVIMDTVAPPLEGHEIAVLNEKKGELSMALQREREEPLKVVTTPKSLQIGKESIQLGFSRNSGGLSSIKLMQKNILFGSLHPSFFRAAANIDRADSAFLMAATIFSKESDWRQAQQQLQYKKFHYEKIGDDFSMMVEYEGDAFKGRVLLQYILRKSGTLEVTMACTPKGPLQRMGLRVRIPRTMQNVLWYGRGPWESYSDRKDFVPMGFFESTPDAMYQSYTRPQENGAHTDTQYLMILDEEQKGLRIRSKNEEGFSFTAAVYSPERLDDSPHEEDLSENEYYELFLDFYQRGIERTGKEAEQFVKNQLQKGTLIMEPVDRSKG